MERNGDFGEGVCGCGGNGFRLMGVKKEEDGGLMVVWWRCGVTRRGCDGGVVAMWWWCGGKGG